MISTRCYRASSAEKRRVSFRTFERISRRWLFASPTMASVNSFDFELPCFELPRIEKPFNPRQPTRFQGSRNEINTFCIRTLFPETKDFRSTIVWVSRVNIIRSRNYAASPGRVCTCSSRLNRVTYRKRSLPGTIRAPATSARDTGWIFKNRVSNDRWAAGEVQAGIQRREAVCQRKRPSTHFENL